jgi:methyl-accepting chemotaxis protein
VIVEPPGPAGRAVSITDINMLHSLSFKQKIGTLVGVAVVGMAVVTAISFVQLKSRIVAGRTAQLVTAVESAQTIVAAYQAQAAAGALPVAEAQKAAKDALRLSRYGTGLVEYVYIWSMDGVSVMHPIQKVWEGQAMLGKVKDGAGHDVVQALIDATKASKTGNAFVDTDFPRPGKTQPVSKLQYVSAVPGWGWLVGSGIYMDDVNAEVRHALYANLAIAGTLLLAIGGIGLAVAGSVIRQIGGDPSDALHAMNDVARGNLAVQVSTHVPGSLLAGLATMIGELRKTVGQVRQSTDSIATASGQIAVGNQDLASRTEQTASNLQQTAASMEELTSTVLQTAESSRRASELSATASHAAAQGGEVVDHVVATMDEINASSKRIEDIIGVIDSIAFQTNILALNAAVEAARAGDQGRGFAVVAAEVRSLAGRSAQAAREIKALIADSVERARSGSDLVARAGATMKDIVSSVDRVSTIIKEITDAAGEQSSGISQVNAAVANLDLMTQQNAALVEESAAAAESMKDQAQRLCGVVQVFQLGASQASVEGGETHRSPTQR